VFLRLNRADVFGFALGAHATLGQVVLMREALALSGGNELAVGLSFTLWLAGVGAGALLAGALSKPKPAQLAGSIISAFIIAGGLFVLRLHREVLGLLPGIEPSLLELGALLLIGLGGGGLTVGFLFTSAARASASQEETPVSRLYAAEAVGALAGGVVFTLFLAGKVPHLVVVGIASCLPAGALALSEQRRAVRATLGVLFISIAIAAVLGPIGKLDRWAEIKAFSFCGAAGEYIAAKDSRYSHLTLGKSEDEYHLFVDGRLDHVFPDPWERPMLIHTALTQHPAPKSVLIIGGGPSDRLEAALAHNPNEVVLTYLDEGVQQICRPFWSPETLKALSDPRVTVVHDDGRRYVSKTSNRFDVVIISARPPLSGQANRYHTQEFYDAVRRVLNKGGAMTSLTSGGANLLAPEAARSAASELATVKSVFKEVVVVPGLQIELHAAADKGVVTDDATLLEARYLARRVKAYSFSSRRFVEMLDPGRVAELKRQLDRWPAEINTDMKPRVYLTGLQLWERSLTGRRAADDPTWTGLAEKWALIWLALPCGLWLVWQVLTYAFKRPGLGAPIISIATTGAAGMASEIVVLLVFQAASGMLYAGLALLVAFFMAGLAVGAYWSRRHLASGKLVHGVLVDAVVLVFLVLTGPVLGTFRDSVAIVFFWSFVAGVVTGSAFPALLGLGAKKRLGDERSAAAAIEAADHFGAAMGALITGIVWVPVFGVSVTCFIFACFKAISLLGLLLLKMIRV
jgi:predicted membrane-bound spermidine synthase